MSRPVILFTLPWLDRPLEQLIQKAAEWGYQGLELTCGGDHFEVQRALSEADY
jgi:sugar phosphate isomerase/epimerase